MYIATSPIKVIIMPPKNQIEAIKLDQPEEIELDINFESTI